MNDNLQDSLLFKQVTQSEPANLTEALDRALAEQVNGIGSVVRDCIERRCKKLLMELDLQACPPGRLLFLNPDLFRPSPTSSLRGKKS